MYSRLKSDIYNLKSRISLPAFAESRQLTAPFAATIAAAHPTSAAAKTTLGISLGVLGVCAQPPRGMAVQLPLYFVFTQYSALGTQYFRPAPHSLIAAAIAQIAIAAAMTEPTAALGGNSRASHTQLHYFSGCSRPSCPPVQRLIRHSCHIN